MSQIDLIREEAESSLLSFIRLIAPEAVLGHAHEDVVAWLDRESTKSHKLLLLPRDHQKSRVAAFYALQQIAKNPCIRILYISSTANLAEKQLSFIKQKLESKIFRRYWPHHINPEKGLRSKWSNTEIELDHPARKKEGVRDPTVFAAGLTTSITGMHCDLSILDDCVVYENAYTEEGRKTVERQISLLTSIEGAEAQQLATGTRYHPKDYYGIMMDMEIEEYDREGDIVDKSPVYDVFIRSVEEDGELLWPRQQRPSDGKWFGFTKAILAKKKAQYTDKTQFYAQYYNNPNSPEGSGIDRSRFQYYERSRLSQQGGKWHYGEKRLNVYASVDFAFSLSKKADFSVVAVVGIDAENNYYVLDVDRFKTDKISDYYRRILDLHMKWGFRKIRCEVTAGQSVIVEDIKNNYIKPSGLALSIDEFRPTRQMGSKHERVSAILQPRYENQQIFHYRGGACQLLEDELVQENPPHDDIKDALASCIDLCIAPTSDRFRKTKANKISANPRFGGIL